MTAEVMTHTETNQLRFIHRIYKDKYGKELKKFRVLQQLMAPIEPLTHDAHWMTVASTPEGVDDEIIIVESPPTD